jgi:RNA polymerase sigma-70 factor (ECF subfamily)
VHAGRFQLKAAIQSAHCQRGLTGRTDWHAIALLYEGLVRLSPSTGALVGRAAAVAEARGAEAGWKLLEAIDKDRVADYQPYWAAAAHLLRRIGQAAESHAAFDRAIGLCNDAAVRRHLQWLAAS